MDLCREQIMFLGLFWASPVNLWSLWWVNEEDKTKAGKMPTPFLCQNANKGQS